jgi:hypothetical protein
MRTHVRSVTPLLLVGLALWVGPAARADVAHLVLNSQAGDFIGQGKVFDITYTTPGTNTISAQIRRTLADGSPAELLFVVDQNNPNANTFGLLFFGTDQLGIPIQPGTYGLPGNTAQRADFAQPGHAGLDVSFQNRGSNTVTGNFTVNSVSFVRDASNTLRVGTFDATFEQHSEGATPALFGHFTFQSSLAAVPEPSPLLLGGLAGSLSLGIGWLRRRAAAA